MRYGVLASLALVGLPCSGNCQSQNCTGRPSSVSSTTQGNKVTIASVEFRGEIPLGDDVRAQLVNQIRALDLHVNPGEADQDWVGTVEFPIREALQERGYFRAVLTVTPYLIRAEADEQRYAVSFEVDSGPQYRLHMIQVSGATAFSPEELKGSFSMDPEDLFNVPKVREGIDSLSRLYGKKGFIDMVATPETKMDENNRIDLLIEVEEGKQYRLGSVEILTSDRNLAQLLKSQLNPGQLFDDDFVRALVQENKALLPKDVSTQDVIQVRRDKRNGVADLILDFQPCL